VLLLLVDIYHRIFITNNSVMANTMASLMAIRQHVTK